MTAPQERSLAPFATGAVLLVAGLTAVAMLVLTARYGYHRDEPYYLVSGARPAWGYVDHPPLVPMVMRLVDALSGHSLVGLRALSALLVGVGIAAGAFIARELGGDRRAQVVAAIVCALAPALRGPALVVGTTIFDGAIWCVLLVLYVRMLRTGSPRWWVAIGAVAGIGLLTKWTVLVLLAGMALGVVVDRRWDLARSGWLVLGAALALAIWTPNLVWNAQHDWATLAFNESIRDRYLSLGGRIEYVVGQLFISGVVSIMVWWPGLRWLLGARDERRWMRPLGIAVVTVLGLFFVSGGKFYYTGALYIAMLAAGSVVLVTKPRRMRTALAVLAAAAVITLPLASPVLPASALGPVLPLQHELGEMVGWPEYVAQVQRVVADLPAEQRARTVVFTGNYGEAAFLERGAPELRVFSGHNSYWWWGPPPDDATAAVILGLREANVRRLCAEPRIVTRITNDAGIDNDEAGTPVWACDRLSAPWSQLWPGLRHYS
jgi:hypothetical protein